MSSLTELLTGYVYGFFAFSGPSAVFVSDKYSACKPGPKLVVVYSGLVQAPANVHSEEVTGHSAMIVWESGTK